MTKIWDRLRGKLDARIQAPLPDYGRRYFEHVLSEYLTDPPADTSPPGGISQILQRHNSGQPVRWADLYVLEKYILKHQPLQKLRRRAWGLRDSYREVVGQRGYDAYLASRPPNENEGEDKIPPEALRQALVSDLERLLSFLHWNYSLSPIREALRTQIVRRSSYCMLGALVGLLALLFWCVHSHSDFRMLNATLLLVAFAGAIGGFVSLQRRMQMVPTQGDPLLSIFQIENGKFTLYLSPISGAVFSLVLFLAFLGDLLAGGVFPDKSSFGILYEKIDQQTTDWAKIALNFAKLMVWSFIAGFAERFVPSTIDRLIERGREGAAPSNTPQPPSPPYGPSASPVPKIDSLAPPTAGAGGPAFTLTVTGTNFLKDSGLRWNGTPRSTRFVSAIQLTAEIPASDIARAGTASVAVSNPEPGGGLSDAMPFTILAGGSSPPVTGLPHAIASPFR